MFAFAARGTLAKNIQKSTQLLRCQYLCYLNKSVWINVQTVTLEWFLVMIPAIVYINVLMWLYDLQCMFLYESF